MAYHYPRRDVSNLRRKVITTAVIMKNIPLDWTTDQMLNFMEQRRIPSPTTLKYLYDHFLTFRGMAFASFASSGEAWHVIQDLNYLMVCGQRLKVQLKRERSPGLTSREGAAPHGTFQTKLLPRSDVLDKAYPYPHPQAKASSAARSLRERTPPSESYDLFMSYQTNPDEKEKLKRFLLQTGNYQEAVNEFAKNRARETQAGEHGWLMEDGTILEKRPPTPGEQAQIDEMEEQFGIGGRRFWKGSFMVPTRGTQRVRDRTEARLLESSLTASIQEKQENAFARQGGNLEEGRDI